MPPINNRGTYKYVVRGWAVDSGVFAVSYYGRVVKSMIRMIASRRIFGDGLRVSGKKKGKERKGRKIVVLCSIGSLVCR